MSQFDLDNMVGDDNKPLPNEERGDMSTDSSISQSQSPRWGGTTKLVVGLSLAAFFAFLLFRFLNLVGPLLLAFILAYLLYPLAEGFSKKVHISWRGAVTILYALLLIVLLGSITVGGLTVVEQVQNLIRFLTVAIDELPAFITETFSQPILIGPFTFDLSLLDVNSLTEQILNAIQPILSRAGSSVVSVASGAASLIGWSFFILIISYFILAESGGIRLISLSIPGHAGDVRRLGMQLGQIWNAFLRGQVIIVLITIVMYTIILGVLGVKFFFGLALLAGLARFVPYVGPFIAWTTYGLVAYFQGSTLFGIPPLVYVGIVVGLAWVTDLFMDNYVTPLLMSNALKVHPAAVMVSALVALNLLGVVGVVMAAPVLATLQLLLNYIFAKLFDRNPWEGMRTISPPLPISHSLRVAQQRLLAIGKKVLKSYLTGAKQ